MLNRARLIAEPGQATPSRIGVAHLLPGGGILVECEQSPSGGVHYRHPCCRRGRTWRAG